MAVSVWICLDMSRYYHTILMATFLRKANVVLFGEALPPMAMPLQLGGLVSTHPYPSLVHPFRWMLHASGTLVNIYPSKWPSYVGNM